MHQLHALEEVQTLADQLLEQLHVRQELLNQLLKLGTIFVERRLLRSVRSEMTKVQGYTINCTSQPTNQTIELSCPN